jgi:hypothetical protein
MSKALEQVLLRNAFELVRDKNCWTRFGFARDLNGDACLPTDREARVWCALGAIQKCAYDLLREEKPAELLARKALSIENVSWSQMYWVNDMRGHKATLIFFQKVVEQRLRSGERRIVLPSLVDLHHTPLREARERERVRRIFNC